MVSVERLDSAAMFPAGRPDLRARYLHLASGMRIRVIEGGTESAPAIAFIPGWACTPYIFRETLGPVAAAGFRVIAVDLKGHGLSDKPASPAEYTVSAMRDNLLEVLDALGLARAGLVGHSMGAAVAVHAAAFDPARCAALALVAPVGFAGVPGLSLLRALTPLSALPSIRRMVTPGLIRLMLRFVYGSGRQPTARDAAEFMAPVPFADFVLALRHLLHEFRWDEPFPTLAMPWLTIVGREDRLSRSADADRYRGPGLAMPVTVIDGVGHVVFDEAPDTVNSALIRFFRERS